MKLYCWPDLEGLLVQELLRRASLEHAGAERASPEEDSFWVEDLIVKLELDPILQNTHAHDN